MPLCNHPEDLVVADGTTLRVVLFQRGRTLGDKPVCLSGDHDHCLISYILVAMKKLELPVTLGDKPWDRVRTIRSCPLLSDDLVLVELAS